MAKSSDVAGSKIDLFKWLAAVFFVVAAVLGNAWFADEGDLLYRVVGVVILILIAAGFALQTERGKAFVGLLKDTRLEIRKIVWPTISETRQTTFIVVVVVIIMAIILWLVDAALGGLVSMFIG